MRRGTRATFIAFVCAATLAVSACGGGENNGNNASPSNTPAASQSEGASSAQPTASAGDRYDPPIEIALVGVTDDTLEGVLAKLPGETFENNRWSKLYEDQLGVKFKYNWIAKGPDQFVQKMNVSIASGDVPEFIQVGARELKQLQEADLIMDLRDVYERNAAPFTKEVMMQGGSASFDAATIDGKLMGIPDTRSSIDMAQFVWVRTDWLQKLKLPEPKTMQDVVAIAEAFSTQDPDGNDKADTVGLLLQKDLFGGFASLEGFFNGFHAYPTIWIEDESGNLVHGSTRPETKAALAELQSMFKKGLLDKEFGVKDWGKAAETASAGKVGLAYGQQWLSAWPFQSNHDNDPNAVWKGYPLMSIDDKPANTEISLGTYQYWAVRKDAKHPEALIKMFNAYIEKNWGKTAEFGKYYLPGDAEGAWKLSPVTPEPANKNLDQYLAIVDGVQNNKTSELTGDAKVVYDKIAAYKNGDQKQWSWAAGYDVDGVYSVMKQYKDTDRFMMNKFVGAPTETMAEKSSTLGKLTNETFTRIILGDLPIDAFDTFVQDWKKLGGDQITTEVNEWYKASKQ
ncbi:extracellular solute-binding protein [Cohnella herbarum]|uniref:Extracellular solute-binding protein n=1 Tax=Cohnella herbarum TaxID=2728023 RepID=A0A7Z2ZPP0_9BACL|nr:extracellular solute-binding protein [Cohnella herbarum]QJD86167.1 extracellular solute-binding protein [Cohnella herbarum]